MNRKLLYKGISLMPSSGMKNYFYVYTNKQLDAGASIEGIENIIDRTLTLLGLGSKWIKMRGMK